MDWLATQVWTDWPMRVHHAVFQLPLRQSTPGRKPFRSTELSFQKWNDKLNSPLGPIGSKLGPLCFEMVLTRGETAFPWVWLSPIQMGFFWLAKHLCALFEQLKSSPWNNPHFLKKRQILKTHQTWFRTFGKDFIAWYKCGHLHPLPDLSYFLLFHPTANQQP